MTASLDFAAARDVMVDGQLRPTKIINELVLSAMRQLPRERFVPAARQNLAYIDDDLQIAPGRYLLRPLTIARLVQMAQPLPGERALIIGAGTCYMAAVLARCGVAVTALEENPALLAIARQNRDLLAGVAITEGKLADGVMAGSPYDLIFIEGAVSEIPLKFAKILSEAGRLITIVSKPRGAGAAVIARRNEAGFCAVPVMDVFAPQLPQMRPQAVFAL